MIQSTPDIFYIDQEGLKSLKLVGVAYSHINREDFATQGQGLPATRIPLSTASP